MHQVVAQFLHPLLAGFGHGFFHVFADAGDAPLGHFAHHALHVLAQNTQ